MDPWAPHAASQRGKRKRAQPGGAAINDHEKKEEKIEKGRERKDTDTPETKGDGERAEQEKSTGAARLGQQKP